MDQVISDLRRRFEPTAGDLDFAYYRLPPESEWQSIVTHYERAVTAEWQPVEGVAEEGRHYRVRVWRREGQSFLIAFIGRPTASDPQPFSILLVATDRGG